MVIWRDSSVFDRIGTTQQNFRTLFKKKSRRHSVELREFHMILNRVVNEGFEISPRFRLSIENRISRLERDAVYDEASIAHLFDTDHIRRHMKLVAVQRAEAQRMKLFLNRTRARLPRPLIEI